MTEPHLDAAHALVVTAQGLARGAVSLAMHAGTVHEGIVPVDLASKLREAAESLRRQADGLDSAATLLEGESQN